MATSVLLTIIETEAPVLYFSQSLEYRKDKGVNPSLRWEIAPSLHLWDNSTNATSQRKQNSHQ